MSVSFCCQSRYGRQHCLAPNLLSTLRNFLAAAIVLVERPVQALCFAPELPDGEIAATDTEKPEIEDVEIALGELSIDQWVPITRNNFEKRLLTIAEPDPDRNIGLVLDVKHRYIQERLDAEQDKKGIVRIRVPYPGLQTSLGFNRGNTLVHE